MYIFLEKQPRPGLYLMRAVARSRVAAVLLLLLTLWHGCALWCWIGLLRHCHKTHVCCFYCYSLTGGFVVVPLSHILVIFLLRQGKLNKKRKSSFCTLIWRS
jgi:hypothetical protein